MPIKATSKRSTIGSLTTVKDSFTLYLAGWQIRMTADFLGIRRKISRVIIKPGVIQCPASYKIPVRGLRRNDWVLYLTDEQVLIVKEKFKMRTAVTALNINAELIKNKSVVFQ